MYPHNSVQHDYCMFRLTLVNTADVVTLTSFVCFCCSLYSADICLCVIIIMLLMTQWRKSGSKAGGHQGEARRAELRVEASRPVGLRAVSYTHLTLPTNREV